MPDCPPRRRPPALLLAVAVLAGFAEAIKFRNPGGPPFLEGPVFEIDPEDGTATRILMTGFVANNSYALTTLGPDGLVTLLGRYTSWDCGPQSGSYLAAVEVTMVMPDGSSTTQSMCELGIVDVDQGTNTWTAAEGYCPSLADTVTLRYFPGSYPEAPNTCVDDFAAAPDAGIPTLDGGAGLPAAAPAPGPDDGTGSPAPAPEAAAPAGSPAPEAAAPAGSPAPLDPAPAGSPTVQGEAGGGEQPVQPAGGQGGGPSGPLLGCFQDCLAGENFKPYCAAAKGNAAVPRQVLPSKCAVRCLEGVYGKLSAKKAALGPSYAFCKTNAQAIYVDQSLPAPQCTEC